MSSAKSRQYYLGLNVLNKKMTRLVTKSFNQTRGLFVYPHTLSHNVVPVNSIAWQVVLAIPKPIIKGIKGSGLQAYHLVCID